MKSLRKHKGGAEGAKREPEKARKRKTAEPERAGESER